MLFKKKKEVVLTNSTVKIFTVAQDVLRFISDGKPFQILHATVSLRDLDRDDDCRHASAELMVDFTNNTIIDFSVSMLLKRESATMWNLADSEIIFSHREDGASVLIAEKDGSYKTSCDYSAEHIREIRTMI